MVALGVYAAYTGAVKVETQARCLPRGVSSRNERLIPLNVKALESRLGQGRESGRHHHRW